MASGDEFVIAASGPGWAAQVRRSKSKDDSINQNGGQRMTRPKSIGVFRLARFQAVLLALVGFVVGIAYSFGGLVYDVATTRSVNLGTALAFLAIFGMPLAFAIGGAILGLVEAILYNLFAKWLGGVELDLV